MHIPPTTGGCGWGTPVVLMPRHPFLVGPLVGHSHIKEALRSYWGRGPTRHSAHHATMLPLP